MVKSLTLSADSAPQSAGTLGLEQLSVLFEHSKSKAESTN